MLKILEEKGIFVNKEWFNSRKNKCIDDIISDYINEDIQKTTVNVFEKNFNVKQIYFINFDIMVQINEIVDISQTYAERLSRKEKDNFTYKILLQHAENKFIGLLNQNIYDINLSKLPGFKILIKRNSVLRYGVIKLTNKNFDFVGGKSDTVVELMCSILIYDKNANANTFKKQLKEQKIEINDNKVEESNDSNSKAIDDTPKYVMIDSVFSFRIIKFSGKMEYNLMVIDEDKIKGIIRKEIVEQTLGIKPEEWTVLSKENQSDRFNNITQLIRKQKFLRSFCSETYVYDIL